MIYLCLQKWMKKRNLQKIHQMDSALPVPLSTLHQKVTVPEPQPV